MAPEHFFSYFNIDCSPTTITLNSDNFFNVLHLYQWEIDKLIPDQGVPSD